MRLPTRILIKGRVRAHTRRTKGQVVRVNAYTRTQENLRRTAMNAGLQFHRNRAKDADEKQVREYLAVARRSKSMKSHLVIWLKGRITSDDNHMSQWATYDRKSAPRWVKDEYKAFWTKVVDIYAGQIATARKSLPSPDRGKLERGSNGTITPVPVEFVPGTTFLRKALTYSMEKDSSCADGEFYLLHPKSGKRYKCKAGNLAEIEKMGNPTDMVKSWSSNLLKQHPGARWVTVTDASSPLHGRHILLLPHADGTASIVWAPEHSGLIHKILQPQEKQKKTEAKLAEKKKAAEVKEVARVKRRAAMTDEDVEKLETERGVAREKTSTAKKEFHALIRKKADVETEVTTKERKAIEKKIEKMSKPEQEVERIHQISAAQKEKRRVINNIIEDAKRVILGDEIGIDEQHSEDKKRIANSIRENAEEFLQSWYAIKGHEKELKVINKQLRTGMVTHAGSDIVGISEITTEDLKRMVASEKAVRDEIAAHYDLILSTRGGIDQDGKEIDTRGSGRKDMEKMISQGSLEAINSITGEMTGTSIISEKFMQELGAANSAILADHYLRKTMGDDEYAAHVEHFGEYIEKNGGQIALDAVAKGDSYLKKAEHVASFAQGEDKLFATRQQGAAAKLAYINRAYLAYGQAEGGLHMSAEMLYQFQTHKKDLVIKSSNLQALKAKMKTLGLEPGDVRVTTAGYGNHEMRIKTKAYKKLIDEKMVAQFKTIEGEPSPQSIKAGRENTPDWLPTNINEKGRSHGSPAEFSSPAGSPEKDLSGSQGR